MKIYLFHDGNDEPFAIKHDHADVMLTNDGHVILFEDSVEQRYGFLHIESQLVSCDKEQELCLLIFVEEKS